MSEVAVMDCPPQCGSQRDRLERLAFRYGQHYDSYLVTEPGWGYFWSRDGEGAVAVAGDGGNWFAGGGLLAPDDKKEELLAEFTEQAVLHRSVLTFFNVGPDDLALFRRFGFQATKWGEEALIDLTTCDWSGRADEWVRRQSNFCRCQGLVFSECPDGGTAADDLAELSEISGLFLANKPQMGEISFLESRFDPRRLGRKRIFIARSHWGSGRIEGFLACNPAKCGDVVDGNLPPAARRRARNDPLPPASGHAGVEERRGPNGFAMLDSRFALRPALAGRQPLGSLGYRFRHPAVQSDLRRRRRVPLQERLPPAV